MLQDFLRQCTCTLPDERPDFREVCQKLEAQVPNVAYMPCITWDLWPVYVLSCTDARHRLEAKAPRVYLMPIGAHAYWAAPYFKNIVLDFYREEVFPEGNSYDYELEEMILLNYPDAGSSLELEEFGACSAVYLHLSHPTGGSAHVFLLMEDPSEGWNQIVRKYDIPVQVLVDSHKGLGDWYENIPLSRYMGQTQRALLPEFYFKGKYISHGAPSGCEHLWDVSESERDTYLSQLYRMNWENT